MAHGLWAFWYLLWSMVHLMGAGMVHAVMVTPSLQQGMMLINPDMPFVHFDLGLSQEEQHLLGSIKITSDDIYNNLYELDKLVPEITHFVTLQGNSVGTAQAAAHIMERVVEQVLQVVQCPTAWIALRFFKKQHTYAMPRWHIDGNFAKAFNTGLRYKIACIFRGPTTLFCRVDSRLRSQFYAINQKKDPQGPSTRQLLYELLRSAPISRATQGQGSLFLIGQHGAIHSEPDIDEDRIYLGIFSGSKEQLQKII